MATSYLTSWDYIVFGTVLVISAGIGVYYRFTGGRQKNVEVCRLVYNFQITIYATK
jgi:hypothetical protein